MATEKPVRNGSASATDRADDRLLEAFAAGDDAAFGRIFARYRDPLRRYCTSIVGNGQDAEDAVQDVAVDALRALRRGDRPATVRGWLFRVARNRCIDQLRCRPSQVPLDPEAQAGVAGVDTVVEQRERLRAALDDMDMLSEAQRSALVMSALGGHDLGEIGARLGAPASAAKHLVHEGRRSLAIMEEGRATDCGAIGDLIDAGDRRALRARSVRAHLHGCSECRRRAAVRGPAPPALAAVLAVIDAVCRGGALASAQAAAASMHVVAGAAVVGVLGSVALVGDVARDPAPPEPRSAVAEVGAERAAAWARSVPPGASGRAASNRRADGHRSPPREGRRRQAVGAPTPEAMPAPAPAPTPEATPAPTPEATPAGPAAQTSPVTAEPRATAPIVADTASVAPAPGVDAAARVPVEIVAPAVSAGVSAAISAGLAPDIAAPPPQVEADVAVEVVAPLVGSTLGLRLRLD